MSLYNQALDTYKAIHGYPFKEWDPWYDASDTPFKGIPVELVSELCDERQVKKYLRQWKVEHTPTSLRKKCWVKSNLPHKQSAVREGYVAYLEEDVVLVSDISKANLDFFLKDQLKVTIPPAGYMDLLELGLNRDLSKFTVGSKVIASTTLRRRYNLWDKKVEGVVEMAFKIPHGYHHYVDSSSCVPCGSVRWEVGISGLYTHMIYDILPA